MPGDAQVTPFGITVYDGMLNKLGTVGAAESVTVTLRHNGVSTAQVQVPGETPRLMDLLKDDARVVMTFDGKFLMSGRKVAHEGSGPSQRSSWTFTFNGDEVLLDSMLAWPVPGAALNAQTSEYDKRTAAAETVLKAVVNANKARVQGLNLVAISTTTDQGRGSSITVADRFHPIRDRIMTAVDGSGIGVTVRQSADGASSPGLIVDCYAERTYPRVLTEESGVIAAWKVSWSAPTATRVVIGGKGDGTARVFSAAFNSTLEQSLHYAVETFLDATDTDTDADRIARGQAYLADNGIKSGLAVSLSQTDTFKFDPAPAAGSSRLGLGDVVTLQIGPRLPNGQRVTVTDRVTAVSLNWKTGSDGGLSVTPQVGDVDTSSSGGRLGKTFAAILRAVRTTAAH